LIKILNILTNLSFSIIVIVMSSAKITTTAKYLLNFCDCVSLSGRGDDLVLAVFAQFPYSNVYTGRNLQKKQATGTLQIMGTGKSPTDRFIVNLFTQFYPGAPKYANDNLKRRLEWLTVCCDNLLNVPNFESIAIPSRLGEYDGIDDISFKESYYLCLNDFRKKYYLRHRVYFKVVDYQDQPIELSGYSHSCVQSVASPIKQIQCGEKTETTQTQKLTVLRKINISQLTWVSPPAQSSPSTSLAQSSQPDPKPMLILKTPQPKEQEPEQKQPQFVADETEDVVTIYEKNQTWLGSISALVQEIPHSWDVIFKDPKMLAELARLDSDFTKEMDIFGDEIEILPQPSSLIFNAFKQCEFPPKCVILGQDPYFSQLNEAHGLSFSVPDGVSIPPSLINIFKELDADLHQIPTTRTTLGSATIPSGNLTHWAQSGVLLLNTALTVRYKQKESHMKLWGQFSQLVIQLLSQLSPSPIVFMLWGAPAKAREAQIVNKNGRHLVLKATHPSPLGANQGGWFGSKPFSQCNAFLIQQKISPVKW
jgi:uracil-DNA glycosylase